MKKIIVFTAMIAVLAGSVFGQALPNLVSGGFTSPQATATQGRIRSAADDFMRPDSYKNVSFENWFAMTSFANTTGASLGYASKKGDLYLGLFYTGTFFANIQTFTPTEHYEAWHGVGKSGVRVYDNVPLFSGGSPSNQLAVLVGAGDMGFRFTLSSTYKQFEDSDFAVDDGLGGPATEYKSLEMGNGAVSPQLAWGMTKNLTDKGIKPWATIDLVFNNTFRKYQEYDDLNNYAAGDETVADSTKYTQFELNLGLGGITIAEKDGWRTSFDFEYLLDIYFYENEYSFTPDGSTYSKIYTISGRRNGVANFDEYSRTYHRLRPSISTQWNGEKLRLRAKLDLNIGINATDTTPVSPLTNGSLHKDGTTAVATTFSFNPDLRLAAQWQLHTRLFLNIGGRININALESTTTEGKGYSLLLGEVANSSYKTVSATIFGATNNTLTLGVTFNPIDNLSLEASCGLTGNNASVFTANANGLFYFGSILAKVTF